MQTPDPANTPSTPRISLEPTLSKYRAFVEELAENPDFYDYFKRNPKGAYRQFYMDLSDESLLELAEPPSQAELQQKLDEAGEDEGFRTVRGALGLAFAGCGFKPHNPPVPLGPPPPPPPTC